MKLAVSLSVLCLTLAWTLSPSASASDDTAKSADAPAPSDDARRLDAIVVTGTRIPRIDLEGPLPVSVIEREQIALSGAVELADAINDLPANSFGSDGNLPLLGLPTQSSPNLRGLGTAYTLVLLDGYRMPAALSNGSGNLTGVPLSVIDRIEVLRDGASAVYGSDAIGGVINLLTRRAAAPQIELRLNEPSGKGGGGHSASFAVGGESSRSRWLLTLETLRREPLAGADRRYLLENAPLNDFGYPGSFLALDPESFEEVFYRADARCPSGLDSDPAFPNSVTETYDDGSTWCFYRLRDLNTERAGLHSRSLFGQASTDLTDTLSLTARVLAWRNDSVSQAAPAPFSYFVRADAPANPTLGELGAGLGYPGIVYYRFGSLGRRRSEVEETNLHALLGLRGTLDLASGADWSLAVSLNRYDAAIDGVQGFLGLEELREPLESGRFNPFRPSPGDAAILQAAQALPHSVLGSRRFGVEGALNVDADWFDAGRTGLAFGFDARRDEYVDRNDPRVLARQIIGVLGGGEVEATRGHAAVFSEALQPLGERLELSLAARYDHYEDAGGALSPKLALAFRPNPQHLFRASLGRGFHAPDLVSVYGPESDAGTAFEVDLRRGAESGNDPLVCQPRGYSLIISSNPELEPERARQAGLGWVWQAHENVELGLDLYRTQVRDQVGFVGAGRVLQNELDCLDDLRSCDPQHDGEVRRNAQGRIAAIVLPSINLARRDTTGLDLDLSWHRDSRLGRFESQLTLGRVFDHELQIEADRPGFDAVGLFGNPRWRATLALDFSRGVHGWHLAARHNDGFSACDDPTLSDGTPNSDCDIQLRSHTELDAQWRWDTAVGELALGARNLANRELPLGPGGEIAYGLHDPVGRTWYLRLRREF